MNPDDNNEKPIPPDSVDPNSETDHNVGDDPNASEIEETLQWDSDSGDSTIEIPPQASDDSQSSTTDLDATSDPNATVEEIDDTDLDQVDIDETVGPDEMPETDASFHPFGLGKPQPKVSETLPNINATIDMGTIQLRPTGHQTILDGFDEGEQDDGPPQSVMKSADISQTIDPRALSKEDAAFWGSAAIDASKVNRDEDSQMRPAIERSIAETKLQIRQRDLSIPTADKDAPTDYRLVRLLGRGGMGNVYVAKQSSLDRMIAVKVIKPLSKDKRESLKSSGRLAAVENDRRQQFLSEAVVTGDLDHPNIVPIHDIAVAADNTLFYAMKRVVGQPWLKSINEKTRDENLEILLKVCDAIAFAHTRGVIHRDIKPENIMLGDFGEVLVMDWGLALAKPEFEKGDSITFNAGLGGTPAFMAPEMARGPVTSIGPHSDIYLLGATLYYIVVGHAPHQAENVTQCIQAVTRNTIQDAPAECHGELLQIALKAMATDPTARFDSVLEFQKAIRSYRSHSESIALSTSAEQELQKALETSNYESFSRASHGFEQAIALWADNESAHRGLERCRLEHAIAARANGDFDLGLSLLNQDDPQHTSLIAELQEELRQRELRASRLKLFRTLAVASVLVILVGGSLALYAINEKRKEADQQRALALLRETEANTQRDRADQKTIAAQAATAEATKQAERANEAEAQATQRAHELEIEKANVEQQRAQAVENLKEANEQRARADKNFEQAAENARLAKINENKAINALKAATYEAYLSRIGLAKARIEANEFDSARQILTDLRDKSAGNKLAWEWRFLWQQANQSVNDVSVGQGIIDVAYDATSSAAIVVCDDGSLRRVSLDYPSRNDWKRSKLDANCLAISPEGSTIAVGTRSGDLQLFDVADGKERRAWKAHQGSISDVQYTSDGRILSGSADRTIALWDPVTEKRIAECWHIAPVTCLVSRMQAGSQQHIVVAGVSDSKTGRAVGWTLDNNRFHQLGVFSQHIHPVVSVALSQDGLTAASGDSRGELSVWRPTDLKRVDFGGAIQNAITRLQDSSVSSQLTSVRTQTKTQKTPSRTWQAHSDSISAMRFSADGQTLLTASDDYTIAAWNAVSTTPIYTLRGHGGWVKGLDLLSGDRGQLRSGNFLSGSIDGTLRVWAVSDPARRSLIGNATKLGDDSDDESSWIQSSNSAGVRVSQLHEDEILAARLDRSGKRLISASRDHTARILGIDKDSLTFYEVSRFRTRDHANEELNEGSEFLAMSAKIDRSANRLFVGSADSIIRIWDLESGTQLGTLKDTGLNNAFDVSRDGRWLISGASKADVGATLWEITSDQSTPTPRHELRGHQQPVTAMTISENGQLAATGDRGGRIILWDANQGIVSGDPIDALRGFRINQLEIVDSTIWAASDNGQLIKISLLDRTTMNRFRHDGFVTAFDLSPDGKSAVTLSSQTDLESVRTVATLWDLSSGQPSVVHQVDASTGGSNQSSSATARINSVRFDQTGQQLVLCSQEMGGKLGALTVIRPDTNEKQSFKLPMQIGAPLLGLMAKDDDVVTVNGEAAFRWSLENMNHQKSYRPHAAVTDACFSPDGRIAATASRSLRLWDTETGAPLDKLESPHRGLIQSMDLTLSPEGQYYLATCGEDARAKLWQWESRETGFRALRDIPIDDASVHHVRFSSDGTKLLLAGSDGTIEVRQLNDGKAIYQWIAPDHQSITCIDFSPDAEYVAAGLSDKTAWLLNIKQPAAVPSSMRGHADIIESICILKTPEQPLRVFTGSRDRTARVWDPRMDVDSTENEVLVTNDRMSPIEGREVLVLDGHHQGVTSVQTSFEGEMVITAGRDGQVMIWPARNDDSSTE